MMMMMKKTVDKVIFKSLTIGLRLFAKQVSVKD